MNYEKQTFVDWELDDSGNVIKEGTTISATHLQHIEDGIVANEKALADKQQKGNYLTEHQELKTINGQSLVGDGNIEIESKDAVLYTEQELTEEQQAQARTNVGAAAAIDLYNFKASMSACTVQEAGWVSVDFEIVKGKVLVNNNQILDTDGNYFISSPVLVTPGEKLLITASKEYANSLYAFYNEAGTRVAHNSPGSGSVVITDEEVTVPVEASTLIIAFYGSNVGAIKRMSADGAMKLQPWKGKIWTVVGDSLTEKNARTDLNYHDYVADATGITVINQGYSGSGYAKSGAGQAFHLRITKVNPASDAVTIFGSFNDLSSGLELGTAADTGTETICGCINTTIDNLIAFMPAVSLGIVTPTPWQNGNPADPNNSQTKYADALVEICKNRSIPCLDLYRCCNLRPWTEEGRIACYSKDDGAGCHPDETGHKLIASRFKGFLESLII